MCFLVTALVEVWPKDGENYLFSAEYYPVAWLGKLVSVEIFLRHHFCSAECLLRCYPNVKGTYILASSMLHIPLHVAFHFSGKRPMPRYSWGKSMRGDDCFVHLHSNTVKYQKGNYPSPKFSLNLQPRLPVHSCPRFRVIVGISALVIWVSNKSISDSRTWLCC